MPAEEATTRDGKVESRKPWRFSFGLAIIALLLLPLYFPLNQETDNVRYLSSAIDGLIPLWPVFILPYLSYFVFIIYAVVIIAIRRDWASFNRLALAIIITLLVSYALYLFFQTGMHRPNLEENSGWLVDLVKSVYRSDNPYNAFPSTHASLTTVCMAALWQWKRSRIPLLIWALLIVVSTVLVKQHNVADMLAGVILGQASYWLSTNILRNRIGAHSL